MRPRRSRAFARSSDRWDGVVVVLKVPKVLLPQRSIARGYALAVVRVRARLHLVDKIAHGKRMDLRSTEDQSLFPLVDLLHEQLYAVRFAFLDLDDPVEVAFGVTPSGLNFAFHDVIIRRVDVFIKRCRNLLDAEGREETVVDALLERVRASPS